MDGRVISPREDEKADRDADTSYHCRGQAGFWRCADFAFGDGSGFSAFVAVVVWNGVDDSGEHADCDAEEGETTNAFAPAAVLLEDDGEGGEHHVQRSIHDRHVNGKEKDNGFVKEEDPGAGNGDFEGLADGLLSLVDFDFGFVDFAGLFAQSGSSLSQEDGSISFRYSEGADDP